jgi:hypothetical protein
MLPENYKRFFQILEVDEKASLQEVTRAYLHLKDFYSHTSTETIPVEQEFLKDHRQAILKQLDTAYSHLKSLYTGQPGSGATDQPGNRVPIVLPDTDFRGALLRQLREEAKLSLADIARDTKIPAALLQQLEAEEFRILPPVIYVRGYVKQYAECLNLEVAAVVDSYMARYKKWQEAQGP